MSKRLKSILEDVEIIQNRVHRLAHLLADEEKARKCYEKKGIQRRKQREKYLEAIMLCENEMHEAEERIQKNRR